MFQYELLEEIITTSLYVVPLAIICFKRKTFKAFSYKKLVVALDYSLIYVVVIFALFFTAGKITEHFSITCATDQILYHVFISYFAITTIFYIPIVLLLNILLISWITARLRTSN